MKRQIQAAVSVLLMLILVLSMAGCIGGNKKAEYKPESTSVYVCKDGTLLCAIVEEFDKSYFDIDELKSFAEEQISAYNEEKTGVAAAYPSSESDAGKDGAELPVTIHDCYLSEDNNAVLILSCRSYDDFYAVNNLEEYSGVISSVDVSTIKSMKSAGETLEDGLFTAGGSVVSVDKVMKKNRYHVVKVSGTGTVYVQGTIKYVSSDVTVGSDSSSAEVNGQDAYIIFK